MVVSSPALWPPLKRLRKGGSRTPSEVGREVGREADGFKLLPFKHLCRALETRVVRKPEAFLL